ncbi:lipopolysaccharide biosynthesis protein [Agarivorans albus]|uniref:Polysaccharide biosynthesis protein n=1 Tax=Agarivorans albus MKT 106 TaxID=1331007 RepID=R9PN93_AGAAL|nr:oligosaccharide flippase family protein [Agarivorans albus]GAD02753.1 polysaccharide biosynthesis protein [Agarivorans albus MKT 106]
MIKKILKNTVVYTIGDFLVVAISGILLLPYYTRIMSVDEYAEYGVVNSLIVLLTFVIQFGIVSTFSRFYFLQGSDERKKIYIGQLLLLQASLTIVVVIALLLMKSFLLMEIISSIDNEKLFYCAIIISICGFLNAMYSAYLRILERPKSFVLFQLISIILYVLFIIIFRFFEFDGLEAVVYALMVSTIIMWCVSWYGIPYSFSFVDIGKTVKETFIFATPVFIAYIMYYCLNKFNILLLQGIVDKRQLAMFTFALQLSTIVTVIAGSAGKAVQPALYKLDKIDVFNVSKKLAWYYKLVMSMLVFIFIFFSENIILFFAPPDFLESQSLLRILILSAFIYNIRSVEASLFFYFKKTRWSLYMTSFSALVVVGSSIIFVPIYGAEASAYAILLGSFAGFLCNRFFSRKLRVIGT